MIADTISNTVACRVGQAVPDIFVVNVNTDGVMFVIDRNDN